MRCGHIPPTQHHRHLFPNAGKEVALFVQEHIAAELVKLEEYKGGDFPGALTRFGSHPLHPFMKGSHGEVLWEKLTAFVLFQFSA